MCSSVEEDSEVQERSLRVGLLSVLTGLGGCQCQPLVAGGGGKCYRVLTG